MGNVCARPKPEEKPAPAPTPTEVKLTLDSILKKSDRTFEDMIVLVLLSRIFDNLFQAKILLFTDEDITNIKNNLAVSVLDGKIKTIDDVQTELIKIIDSMSNKELDEVKAAYFNELYIYVINTISAPAVATSLSTNYSTYQQELIMIVIRAKCHYYSIVNDATRLELTIAKSRVLCELITEYPLITLPTGIITTPCGPNPGADNVLLGGSETTTTTTEEFENKNDRINEELKKKLRLIFEGTIEPFRNKKIKRENNFSGYSLEYSSLLPKDYANF